MSVETCWVAILLWMSSDFRALCPLAHTSQSGVAVAPSPSLLAVRPWKRSDMDIRLEPVAKHRQRCLPGARPSSSSCCQVRIASRTALLENLSPHCGCDLMPCTGRSTRLKASLWYRYCLTFFASFPARSSDKIRDMPQLCAQRAAATAITLHVLDKQPTAGPSRLKGSVLGAGPGQQGCLAK